MLINSPVLVLGTSFPLALARFCLTGTTTPATVYQDAALTTPFASPIVADVNGIFPEWYHSDPSTIRLQVIAAGGSFAAPLIDVDPANPGVTDLNITYTPPGAGTHAYILRNRLGYDINIMDYISSQALRDSIVARTVGAGAYTQLTADIQSALDNAPLGCRLIWPPGTYPVNNTLLMSRQMDLIAPGGMATRLTGNMVDTRNLLNVKVSVAAALAGDVRLMQMEGLCLYCNAGGGDLIYVENQAPMASNLQMGARHVALGGGSEIGRGMHFKGVVTQVHVVERSLIYGGIHLDGVADSCTFRDLLMGPNNAAFTVDMAEGAWKTLIEHCTIVNKDGAIDIRDCGQVDIVRCQMEQSGVNAGLHQSTVNIAPANFGTRLVNVEGCNFGGGGNVQYSIWADGGGGFFTDQLRIGDNNTFNTTNTGIDVVLNSASVRWADISPEQRYRGNRNGVVIVGRVASANTADARMAITDNGLGTMGIPQPASTLALNNGWTASADFSYTKDSNGLITFTGHLNSGIFAPGTVFGVMPAGFRPSSPMYVPCGNSATSASLLYFNTNGNISTVSGGANPSEWHLTPYRVARHTKYDPGV